MESGPSKIAEALVYWLLPPACREEILGDLRERNSASAQFLIEAAITVPSVIYSRVRRTTDPVIALMQTVSAYTAYVMCASWLDHDLLLREYGFARLAVPTVIYMTTVVLVDAYHHPEDRRPYKMLFGPTLAIALTYLVELTQTWRLSLPILAWGGVFGFLIISTLRLIFPPIATRSQTVGIPAFWQKLEPLVPSISLRYALVPCVLLVTAILYLFLSHHL